MLVKLLRSALRIGKDPEEYFFAGLEHYRAERYAAALKAFERALAIEPSRNDYRYQAAACEYMLGRLSEARRRCEDVLATEPAHARTLGLLAQISLPGPDYLHVLATIHHELRPATYFEVGVFRGHSLRLAQSDTRVVGVDPNPLVAGDALPPNVSVHAMTSDAYFARRSVVEDLGGPIALAFIDGLHHFDAALRDFINIERHCTRDSIVLVHDWCPLTRATAEREPIYDGAFYVGDVWRLALLLKKYRPDLQIATIATAPSGLGVIRRLDPQSSVLGERFDEIVEEFMALDYGTIQDDKRSAFNLIPNDWPVISGILERSPQAVGA